MDDSFTMSMYAPLLRREALLILLDARHHVALLPTGPDGRLALPSIRRRERETYDAAVRRITVGTFHASTLRLGEVIGRVEPPPPVPHAWSAPAARREARIFFAHFPKGSPSVTDHSIRWVPHTSVAEAVTAQDIPELGPFIEGYIDGWIPDGWITLGP
ncbi:hypothetical protein OG897_04015 [Streptomyces sp. NBC_00237]|uniref:hypothetical protein n=1 Tax=Streptomyces sp. NBC_00237 TaxID=2975687 RepID=UPI00224EDAA4|nr:hypothetical protein [Streptomyces sp. NBC_00237]MCX5200631.1 hypothetical protein [Streptomyces sp. NBC_00237]